MECSISVLMKIRVMSPLNALDAMVQYEMDDMGCSNARAPTQLLSVVKMAVCILSVAISLREACRLSVI